MPLKRHQLICNHFTIDFRSQRAQVTANARENEAPAHNHRFERSMVFINDFMSAIAMLADSRISSH